MRDIKRIDKILNQLKYLWMRFPDQRLGQLLDNYVFGYKSDSHLFYVEDDTVEDKLTEIIKDHIILEELAELEHIQWSSWVRDFLEFDNPDNRKMWKRETHSLYGHLTEEEKDFYREQAKKVLELLNKK